MRQFYFFFIFLIPVLGLAQKITLSGKAQDKTTGEPLPFASVGFKGKSMGTVTNLQGEFDFHFPGEYKNEILVISMLGYKNFEAPVWALLEGNVKVMPMEKSITMLQEVEVKDSLNGGEILKIAMQRVERNFPMQPFLLEGFYRDVKKVGETHIALLEAAVKIYDEDYAEPRNNRKLRERVKLIEVRKSLGYENALTPYFGQRNLLEDLLLHNNIRYRDVEADEDIFAEVIREKDSYYNDNEVYVVSYSHDFIFRVVIEKESFSIIHVDYEDVDEEHLAKQKNLISNTINIKKSIEFKRYQGKMFLNYITVSTKEDWYDAKTNQFKFQTELVQHLLINDVTLDPAENISATEKMRNYGLQYQDYPYNKEFWDKYNVIKETPIDEKIQADLEKVMPLEKQFQEY